jgi:uncharacterized protein YjbI with pentapeptide repeats
MCADVLMLCCVLCAVLLPQANAVSDKVLDLRKCDYTGKNLSGKTLAGALLSETNMSNTNLQEAVLTKVRAWAQQRARRLAWGRNWLAM